MVCPVGQRLIAFGVGLEVLIGLLLASVGAATTLADERAQGGLDVVLATPIDSRRIVLGKWWGAFRIVPCLAILPVLAILKIGLFREMLPEALWLAALVVALVLAYGAVVTSLGLLIAIQQGRQRLAVAWTVTWFVGMAVIYPGIVIPIFNINNSLLVASSPFFGIYIPTFPLDKPRFPSFDSDDLVQGGLCLGLVMSVALVLLKAALNQFDRKLGRVADASVRDAGKPEPELAIVGGIRDR